MVKNVTNFKNSVIIFRCNLIDCKLNLGFVRHDILTFSHYSIRKRMEIIMFIYKALHQIALSATPRRRKNAHIFTHMDLSNDMV